MRIGIDCRTILNPGFGEGAGIGHYTYYLVKNLIELDSGDEIILFFDRLVTKEAADKFAEGRKNVKIRFFPFHQYRRYLPFVYSHLLVSAFLEKERLDVYHNPANIIPLRYKGKSVITIHDLAIYKNPNWFPRKLGRQIFSTKLLIPSSVENASKIIAVSRSTKNDLMEIFKVPENKIKVIYEGAERNENIKIGDKKYLKNKFKISNDYILYLGTIEPRKNIESLIKACQSLNGNLELVIAGARGWKYEKVFKLIDGYNKKAKKEEIEYLGYVSFEDKIALMKNALCFVFPTFYEGFGLPVLEAMSLGTPVISSNISSIPEIVGETGILVNPYKEEELIEALRKITGDKKLRERLSLAGKERAGEFSWEKCAKETLDVYREMR
jgi:glycosyltransferase involved in cell wall biosynthesis